MDRFDVILPAIGLAWAALGILIYRFRCSERSKGRLEQAMFPYADGNFSTMERIGHVLIVVPAAVFLILSPLFRLR